MGSLYKVFITDIVWPDIAIESEILREIQAEVRLSSTNDPNDRETLIREGADCDVIMALFAPMDRQMLTHFKQCKLLVRLGIGYNSVDIDFATKKGIQVANVPDYCAREVADFTLALFLESAMKISHHDRNVRAGYWDMDLVGPVPRLSELTFGVWGCGSIGKLVAQRVFPFVREVTGYDPLCSEGGCRAAGIRKIESLDQFLTSADCLSLHMPLTSKTNGIVNKETLSKLKPEAFLINTSRGGLVREEDLVRVLEQGKIRGAALDVLCDESPGGTRAFAELDNVILTPHAAWNSTAAIPELRRKAAREVVYTFKQGRAGNLINTEIFENQ